MGIDKVSLLILIETYLNLKLTHTFTEQEYDYDVMWVEEYKDFQQNSVVYP